MKAWHITGYTFAADEVSPEAAEEWAFASLLARGVRRDEVENAAINGVDYDPGFAAHRAEALLILLAGLEGIDYMDVESYDSSDFPKPIFASDN